MSLYLHPTITPETIAAAAAAGITGIFHPVPFFISIPPNRLPPQA